MSIVNKKYGHVFVHVPKTGGTSMERTWFVGGNDHEKIERMDSPSDCFRWGFVRNPFDRLVSVHSAIWQHPNKLLRKFVPKDFDEFVQALPDLREFVHITPQVKFLCIKGKIAVDFVGRYEDLYRDWAFVCWNIGRYATIPHINKTEHKPWGEYYTSPQTVDAAIEYYKDDFKVFGYRSEIYACNSDLSDISSP